MEYCKCGGKQGYTVKDGQLICNICGGLSPKAKIVNNQFVKIGNEEIRCPKCGEVIQEKMRVQPEDKMASPPENKQVWPAESKRATKVIKRIKRRR